MIARHQISDLISYCIREANPKGLDMNRAILLIEPDLFDIDIGGIMGFECYTVSWCNLIQIAFPYEASEKEVVFMSCFKREIENEFDNFICRY